MTSRWDYDSHRWLPGGSEATSIPDMDPDWLADKARELLESFLTAHAKLHGWSDDSTPPVPVSIDVWRERQYSRAGVALAAARRPW